MSEIYKCPYCGKLNPQDKKGRKVKFCSKEHRKLYTQQCALNVPHYCNVCGNLAAFDFKYNRWKQTCGNPACLKQAAQKAQLKGAINHKHIHIIKNELIDLYIKQNLSRQEIAHHYHCSEATIKKYLRLNNIYKGITQRDIHTKKTKLLCYGDACYINVKKRRQTCLQKYGAPSNLCLYKGVKPQNSSKEELAWIQSFQNPDIIPHHVIKVAKYKWVIVDGYNPQTNTVFEFLGDYFHGNLSIYNPNKINKTLHKRMKTLNKETFQRFDLIKNLGYNIIYIWEKDYKEGKPFLSY